MNFLVHQCHFYIIVFGKLKPMNNSYTSDIDCKKVFSEIVKKIYIFKKQKMTTFMSLSDKIC